MRGIKVSSPTETLNVYANYLEEGATFAPQLSDGELLDIVIEATKEEPSAEGLPTDRDILVAIHGALYQRFKKEFNYETLDKEVSNA